MNWKQVVSSVALVGQLALHLTAAERDSAQPKAAPPVLRSSEPTDNVVLKLPGGPAAPKRAAAPAPVPTPPPTTVPAPTVPTPAPPAFVEMPPIFPSGPILTP